MRISDWSSDVCSSDLELDQRTALPAGVEVFRIDGPIFFGVANDLMDTLRRIGSAPKIIILRMRRVPLLDASGVTAMGDIVDHAEVLRSEEHTSELQSLMRISYAVFCLKNKNNH